MVGDCLLLSLPALHDDHTHTTTAGREAGD